MLSKAVSEELKANQRQWLQDIDVLIEKNQKHTQNIMDEQQAIQSNEKEISKFRQWIAVSEQIMGQDISLVSTEIPKEDELLKSATALSLPQAILNVLDSDSNKKFTMTEIKNLLPTIGYKIPESQYFTNSLFNTLIRLNKSGKIGVFKEGPRKNLYYSLKNCEVEKR